MVTRRGSAASAAQAFRKPDGALSDDEIATILRRKINECLNRQEGELSQTRQRMLHLYRGGPVGASAEDESSFTTREIYEMVEDGMPSLMSIFFSAKTPVVFGPRQPDDKPRAKFESAVVDHYLFRRGNSYLDFYHFFKSAWIDPAAYMKVHCVHTEHTVHHRYAELTDAQLLELMSPKREWKRGTVVEEVAQPDGSVRYRFEGTEVKRNPRFYTDPVPPENLLVDREATSVDLDEVFEQCGFIAHREAVPFTELVNRGYDPDELDEAAGKDAELRFNDETTTRRYREDEGPWGTSGTDYSTRKLAVYECYVKMDCDGSGVADGWRIVMVGDTIFERTRTTYQPFVGMSAVPMMFKHAGISPAEALESIQLLRTKLMRIALNDQYRNEERRVFVDKSAMTPRTKDQLMDRQAAFVEVKGPPGNAIMPEPRFSILQDTLGMLQYSDDLMKRRTGMATDVALNPDVLRDATAHGMLASMDRSSARLMHIARMFAEQGVKKAGLKMHQLLRMYQDERTFQEINGEFVEVDPADWYERTEMRVTVGLGFNSKQDNLMALTQLLALQKEALSQGMARPEHLKTTLEKMIEAADVGFYSEYFVDPEKEEVKPPPPPPDPQMESVKAQREVAELQEQTKQAQIDADIEQAEIKAETERLKIRTDRQRIAADAALKKAEARMESTLLPERKKAELDKMRAEIDVLHMELDKTSAEVVKLRAEAAQVAKESSDEEGQQGAEEAE